MGRRPRIHFPGAIFHVMTRGNGGQDIFHTQADWWRFLEITAEIKRARPFKLHAYCLMPNHIHLLIEVDQVPLDKIAQLIKGRYSAYLNSRLQRKGHVFEERYKALLCQSDSYLLELVRYIHLNPVRAGLVTHPDLWPWSGNRDYLNPKAGGFVDTDLILSMLGPSTTQAVEAYRQFLLNGIGKPLNPTESPADPYFRPRRTDDTAVLVPPRDTTLQAITAAVAKDLDIRTHEMLSPYRSRRIAAARRVLVSSAFLQGFSVTEIATFLDLSKSAVSQLLSQAQKLNN